MKYKKLYLIFSLIVLVPGIISLIVFGLDLSIDFTGGSVFEYDIGSVEDKDGVKSGIEEVFSNNNVGVHSVVFVGDNNISARTVPVSVEKNEEIKVSLSERFEGVNQVSFETVGPSIGRETTQNSFLALGVASVGILLYIAYAFRNVPKPYSSFRFGASAIIAMLHDAFLVLGVFSILGYFFDIEVDALFITAVLTVIGFSVHDSIVVFDRIRENLKKLPSSWDFEKVVNFSLVETLNRSLALSLTAVITLFAMFMLGGESIRYFVLAMLIGIVSGTYSSIFTASPLLVIWEGWVSKRKK